MHQNGKCPKTLPLRAHHLLCVQGFQGHGYGPEFLDNLSKIVHEIMYNPHLFLEIVQGPDAICKKCPNLSDSGCNITGGGDGTIQKIDKLVMDKLGLFTGQIEQSIFFIEKTNKISVEGARVICWGCGWQEKCIWYQKKAFL